MVNIITTLMMASPLFMAIFILLVTWSIIWKGIALWKSARNRQLAWFIAILVINTEVYLKLSTCYFFKKNK